MVKYTDNQRRLIFSLIEDFSLSYYKKKDSYYIKKSEELLKKEYMKFSNYLVDKKKPFDNYRYNLKVGMEEGIKEGVKGSEGILDIIENITLQEVQKLNVALKGTFSLKMNIFSKDDATKFIEFLIGYFFDNQIEIKQEIVEMMKKEDENRVMFMMIKHKKCAICGAYSDLHHWDNVSRIGGYKFDDGLKTRFLPLCRKHHSEFHSIGPVEFTRKYKTVGVWLNKAQVAVLKGIYKNHFKAFKGE